MAAAAATSGCPHTVLSPPSPRLDLDHGGLGRLCEADLPLQGGRGSPARHGRARRQAVAARQRVEVASVGDRRVVGDGRRDELAAITSK